MADLYTEELFLDNPDLVDFVFKSQLNHSVLSSVTLSVNYCYARKLSDEIGRVQYNQNGMDDLLDGIGKAAAFCNEVNPLVGLEMNLEGKGDAIFVGDRLASADLKRKYGENDFRRDFTSFSTDDSRFALFMSYKDIEHSDSRSLKDWISKIEASNFKTRDNETFPLYVISEAEMTFPGRHFGSDEIIDLELRTIFQDENTEKVLARIEGEKKAIEKVKGYLMGTNLSLGMRGAAAA